jgi:NADH pyrophosphatase NudC (nudix superfamily)
MEPPRATFRFCPSCGQKALAPSEGRYFECSTCGYRLYHNTTVAVAPLIFCDDKLLLVRRARDPHRGKLGVPGGFVDAGESAEAALRRELDEELKLRISAFSYFGGWPNQYPYRGITYDVLDLYFLVRTSGRLQIEPSEVQSVEWHDPWELSDTELAFPSLRAALALWRSVPRVPLSRFDGALR